MTRPLLQESPRARVVEHVAGELDALIARCPFDPAAMEAGCARVEQLARRHLLRAFQAEGIFVAAGEQHNSVRLLQQLGVLPAYRRLFHILLDMLAQDGVNVLPDGRVTTSQLPDTSHAACAALREALLADHPDRATLIPLVDACAPEALAVVGGRKSAVEVLFPGGSSALVENVYARDAVSGFFNTLTAHAVETLVRSRRAERTAGTESVLEVGAGTGGTTAAVLAALATLTPTVSYHCTDISAALLQQTQGVFGVAHPDVRFRPLDIGADPVAQGFERAANDVVVAANVLHATRDIATTLTHVRQLLRPGGVLVLNEVTRAFHFTSLTFGLTTGWWLFDDEGRIPGAPLLSIDGWSRALTAAGFSDVRSFTPFRTDTGVPPQTLILGVNGDQEALSWPQDLMASGPSEPSRLVWQQLQIIDAQLELLGAKGRRL
jgi:SAM-dependent methyltransferase